MFPSPITTDVILSSPPTLNFFGSPASASQTLTNVLFKCGIRICWPYSKYAAVGMRVLYVEKV